MIRAAVILSVLAFTDPAAADETFNAAQALAQKFANADKTAPANSEQKQAQTQTQSSATARDRPSLDYEMDMLRRARAEQAEWNAAKKPVVAPSVAATPPTETGAGPEAPQVAQAPSPTGLAAAKADVPPAAAPAPVAEPAGAKRATLLLAIEMGGSSKMADLFHTLAPMLCLGDACYISTGIESDAVRLPRAEAVKLMNSPDSEKNSCNGMAGCIFRNVSLPDGAKLKLVELGSGLLVESLPLAAIIDATCSMSEDGLTCLNPIATTDFRIWTVPEATAIDAGSEALEDAVADGLPNEDIERSTDK
jgi:hypothetical protein